MNRYSTIVLLLLLSFAKIGNAQIIHEIPKAKALKSESDTISIAIVGDVMMHTRQLEHDHTHFLKHIQQHLRDADIAIANMEFALGGRPYSGYPAFSAPDSYAEDIANNSSVDVFLVANNHILDKGKKGMRRTLHVYDSLRVAHTGIDYPLYISRRGIKIALINFTYGTNMRDDGSEPRVRRMDKEEISQAFSKAKNEGADFILALPHWGTEYQLIHNETQEEWAEWLISQGSDAIIGTHPHVIQDTTHIAGRPVIYSLGNSVSNMSAKNTRLGLIAKLRFVINHTTRETAMLEPELEFTWCTLPGMLFENYATIIIKEWATRRDEWLTPSDYDNMISTLERVKSTCNID